jgi:hypothetical protein
MAAPASIVGMFDVAEPLTMVDDVPGSWLQLLGAEGDHNSGTEASCRRLPDFLVVLPEVSVDDESNG